MWRTLKGCIPNDHARQVTSAYFVDRLLRAGPIGRKVLDFGCGTGDSVELFRGLDPTIDWHGIDIESSLEVDARRRSDAQFHVYDGSRLPFADESFDIVFSHQVFEHIRHPEALLAEVARVLRRGGAFVGSVAALEPFHSKSYVSFTPFGWHQMLLSADLTPVQFRPGIDAIALIRRQYLGRPPEADRWVDSSPLNEEIDLWGASTNRRPALVNLRKLRFCGHLVFLAGKSGAPAPRLAPDVPPIATPTLRARLASVRIPHPPDIHVECPTLSLEGAEAFHIGRKIADSGLGAYEPEVFAMLCALLEQAPHACFLDVGANIGIFSLIAKRIFGKRVKVTAFEPLPTLRTFLQGTAQRNGIELTVLPYALSSRDGRADFYVSRKSDTSSSLNVDFRPHKEVLEVEVRRLDALFTDAAATPFVLKIDTESTEPDVLEGGLELIAQSRPALICEVLPGRTERQLERLLERLRYTAIHVTDRPRWEGTSTIHADESSTFRDWLFVPELPPVAVRERFATWRDALGFLPAVRDPEDQLPGK